MALRLFPLVLAVILTACSSHRIAPAADGDEASKPAIREQSMPLRQSESPTRTVVHGDTLYSIAWESGRDYRELAKWNHIRPPYTIKIGQVLLVAPPAKSPEGITAADKSESKPAVTVKKVKPQLPPVAVQSGKKPVINSNANRDATQDTRQKNSAVKGFWIWPADGQILKRYSAGDVSKGIDIGGSRGQPVRAAAGGRVVYQGSGLRGYGQLIIIKHSDEFLSAYAHNDRIYVKEGDVVKRGQKIAGMGSTGTDRVKLHFEIRRQGVPSDPLKYLPKR